MPIRNIPPTSRRVPSRKTPDTVSSGGISVKKKLTGPARCYCVINRGGGTGKTTLSSGLSTHFALSGYAALLIELDDHARAYLRLVGTLQRNGPPLPAAKTSYALLHPGTYSIHDASFQIDMNETFHRSGLAKETIERIKVERNWQSPNMLDLIPGSQNLRGIDSEFALAERVAQIEAETFDPNSQLLQSIDHFRNIYDVIVIDTPAGLGKLTWNALLTSDYVLMPMAFDPGSIEDFDETYRTYEQVASICLRLRRIPPKFLGYVGNFFSRDSTLDRAVFQSYIGPHPDPDIGTMVPAAIPYPMLGCLPHDKDTLANAWAKHMTIHTYAPQSEIGKAMYDFCVTTVKASN